MNKQQSGFTLIELIVVIVILGILAATIVPRFANIQTDARIAVVSGFEASVRSASSMYHGVKLALGTAVNVDVPQSRFENVGADVDDANFYPAGTATGITAIIEDTSGDFTAIACAAGVCEWRVTAAGTPTTCYVRFTQAGVGGSPAIITDTMGC